MSKARRLRHVAQVNPPTPEFDQLPDETEVSFLPLDAVWPGARLNTNATRIKSEVSIGYTRFREGDVLVPKITPTFEADRSTIALGLKGGVGAGTTELHIVRANAETDCRYVDYLLSCRPFLLGGEAEMYGVAGQKRVPDTWLRNFPVPVVDIRRQQVIADFLDAETARIDALIAKKRRLVELLDNRAVSVIASAFGLETGHSAEGEPNAVGHHRMVRLGAIATVQSGLTLDAGRDLDGLALIRPYLRVANVQDGWVDLSEVKEVKVPQAMASRCALKPGDVLMTEGGDPDKLGRGTVWQGEIPGCLHQNHIFAVRPGNVLLPGFLALLSRTPYARAYFEMTASKTTGIASTSTSKIASFRIPLPSIGEQRRLVHDTTSRLTKIADSNDRIGRQIGLLQEHRQALITSAVTGEMDIPETLNIARNGIAHDNYRKAWPG